MYQRWFPYRCIKSFLVFLIVLFFYSPQLLAGISKESLKEHSKKAKVSDVSKVEKISLPPLLVKVEEKYKVAKTIIADFNQENEIVALKQKKPSSGKISVKRPDKVRWETMKPEINLLVSDGKKIWNYTPPFDEDERGQVIEMKTKNFKSSLAAALLAGSFSVAKDMKIQKLESDADYVLLPRKGSAGGIKEAKIKIDTEKLYIIQVVLVHKEGNRTEINLSNIELGKEIADQIFEFEVPPNTDRVEQK